VLEQSYEVYFMTDASGGVSAIDRMVHAGASSGAADPAP
jgi:hypothetical protein